MINPAKRIKKIEEYYFSKKLREIAKLKSQGIDIINLGIGNPDLDPPNDVMNYLSLEVKKSGIHGYQSYKGTFELRSAFSNWYKKYFKVNLNPDNEILPLMGSKEGILHITMSYIDPNDEVLIPNPGYPAYSSTAKLAGGICKFYDLNEKNGWMPDFNTLEKYDLTRVKLMWVNYPNMPTGVNATDKLFFDLKSFGEKHKILICNDNPYSFIGNTDYKSIFMNGFSNYLLELNSLSKSHRMAGWRMGMVLGNEEHINNILKFKSNMDSGMFLPLQKATVKALEIESVWYCEQNSLYNQRRKVVNEIMDILNCKYNSEQVGMFVWAKLPNNITNEVEWVDFILSKARVFIAPGFIFGNNGTRYIRISLCSDIAILNEALKRIKNII